MRRTFQVPRKRDASDSQLQSGPSRQPAELKQQQSVPLRALPTSTGNIAATAQVQVSDCKETAFQALYTARSNKKRNNKTWSGAQPQQVFTPTLARARAYTQHPLCIDGFILLRGAAPAFTLQLYSDEGKLVTKASRKEGIAPEDQIQVRLLTWRRAYLDPS